MTSKSRLLTVSVLVEQAGEEIAAYRTDNEIQEAVTTAIANLYADKPDTIVQWQSLTSARLDGNPTVGRCAICNRWVYDEERRTVATPTGICRGATVNGQLLCDEHLPEDHPLAF